MAIYESGEDYLEAVLMIDPRNLVTLLQPQLDTAALKAATPIGKGLGASPGAACGKIVFTAEDAEEWNARGDLRSSSYTGGCADRAGRGQGTGGEGRVQDRA